MCTIRYDTVILTWPQKLRGKNLGLVVVVVVVAAAAAAVDLTM